MLTSYHVHSTYSDGKNTILELAEAAARLGLDELGISDHLVLIPGESVFWSMEVDSIDSYIDDIRAASDIFRGKVTLRYGLECDYIPESASDVAGILERHKLDYVIGSVHFFDGFPIDESATTWDSLSERELDDMIRAYWSRITEMAKSGLFDFAAHLDLYKKFGHKPTVDITSDIDAALDAIAKANMAVEINTAGWFVPGKEVYPSPEILRGCHKRGIPILINSDAHTTANLTRGYTEAQKLASEIGYSEVAVYEKRSRRMVSLQ